MRRILAGVLSFLIIFVLGVSMVYGQAGTGSNTGQGTGQNPQVTNIKFPNPFKTSVGDSLPQIVESVVKNIVLPFGILLAVLGFIYSGFLYVTAQGNTTKIQTAHRALTYTVIGTTLLLGAWVIAQMLKITLEQFRS